MEKRMSGAGTGYLLTVCFLIGMLCAGMMLRLQLTEYAKASAEVMRTRLSLLTLSGNSAREIGMFALQLFVPGGLLALGSFCFGLCMIGQPVILSLYTLLGLVCGSFGMSFLMQGQGGYALLWFLPFAVAYSLTLFPVGKTCLTLGLRLMSGQKAAWKQAFRLTVRQLLFLAAVCAVGAVAAGWILHG